MDCVDKELLKMMQEGIPLVSRPFAEVAKRLGISEEEVLSRIRKLMENGVIRRFGASIRPERVGLVTSAMIVWKVPPSKVVEVGNKMAQFKEVTHCYERQAIPGKWEFNLYCVIHGHSKKDCEEIAKHISNSIGIKEYMLLFSEREFKNTSVKLS